MQLPAALLTSLQSVKGFDRDAFLKVHESGEQVTSVRINRNKPFSQLTNQPINQLTKVKWCDTGYYLSSRPSFTFDPLFHAGCYYVQEASSMFLEQALKQTTDLSKPLKVLDLCAAPGGKSTHIQSLISKDSLLVSNEAIKNRCNILKDNIIKWGCKNVVVTNNDPRDFARLENFFDVIVVDAPCSGSGLFRKEPDAIEHWSENNVQLCCQRQQRILADAWPALKDGGVLIYSTCSYSMEEDEAIAGWLMNEFKIENLKLRIDDYPGVIESSHGYRFWPDKVKGEGFFISVFRKKDGGSECNAKAAKKLNVVSGAEPAIIKSWLSKSDDKIFIHGFDGIHALEKKIYTDLNLINSNLRVAYFGAGLGEIMKNNLVPAHSLAMSSLLNDSVPRINLDYEQAIRYLQKKDIEIENKSTGWQLICYNNHPLGWIKAMPGRVNNYYPKELRILKDN